MNDLSDMATDLYLTGYAAFQRMMCAEDSVAREKLLAESALFSGAARDLHHMAADNLDRS